MISNHGLLTEMKNKIIISVFLLAFLLLHIFSQQQECYALIHYVPQQYDSIQEAIDNSIPHDTVLVAPGEYLENLLIDQHELVLASTFLFTQIDSSIEQTVIKGTWPEHTEGRGLSVYGGSEEVDIIGLTFIDGNLGSLMGGGIIAEDVTITIYSCHFSDNHADYGGGIRLSECEGTIINCQFHNNSARIGGGLSTDTGDYTIHGCAFYGNLSSYMGGGMYACGVTNSILNNCTFQNNISEDIGGAVEFGASENASWLIENNFFKGNSSNHAGAIYIGNSNNNLQLEFTIRGNRFVSNLSYMSNGQYGSGGTMVIAVETGEIEVCDNLFESNIAERVGAALIITFNANIHHNLFINNHANGCPIICAPTGNVPDYIISMTYNTFVDNGPLEEEYVYMAEAIGVSANAGVRLAHNDFIGNDGPAVGTSSGLLEFEANYWGDPSGCYHETEHPEAFGDTILNTLDYPTFSPVPFTSYRAPHIRLPERNLNFGLVEVGQPATLNLWVRNGGMEELALYDIRCENEQIAIPEFIDSTAGTGVNLYIPVVYTPAETGLMESFLEIRSNSPQDTMVRVHVLGEGTVTGVDDDGSLLPENYSLSSPYPNPCNAQAVVRFTLPEPNRVRISLINLIGREVDVACNGSYSSGEHSISINTDSLAAGMYFVRMVVPGEFHSFVKLVVIK